MIVVGDPKSFDSTAFTRSGLLSRCQHLRLFLGLPCAGRDLYTLVLAAGKLGVIEATLSTATSSKKDARLLCLVFREGQKLAKEYKRSFTEAFLRVISDAEIRLRIGIRDIPCWAREEISAPEDEYCPDQWIDSRTSERRLENSASP